MEDKKDLGRLFRDRLTQVEAEPHTDLWDNIETTLDEKRRKKRGFLLLWSGIAILLGVLFTAYFVLNTNSELNQTRELELPTTVSKPKSVEDVKVNSDVIDSIPNENYDGPSLIEQNNIEKIGSESVSAKDPNEQQNLSNKKKKNIKIGNSSNTKKAIVGNIVLAQETATASNKKKSITQKEVTVDNGAIVKREQLENNNKLDSGQGKEKVDAKDIEQKDTISETKKVAVVPKKKTEVAVKKIKKEGSRKMLISIQAAPTYYDFISRGHAFKNDSVGGQLSGNISVSYGGLLNIPITDKMTFRFGFRHLNTRSTIKNASSRISASGNAGFFTSNAIDRNGNIIPADLLQSINSGEPFTIEQKSSYSELPIEFTYTFGNKKLKLDAIGGISFQLLGKSTVAIKNSGGGVELGSSSYLKKVSFTPNIGLGIRYQLTDRVRLDLEPTLRYQFNAFEKSYNNQKPFILGVYTGFTIKL